MHFSLFAAKRGSGNLSLCRFSTLLWTAKRKKTIIAQSEEYKKTPAKSHKVYPSVTVSHLTRHISLDIITIYLKGTNPPLKKSLNIPEIYAKMFGRFH